jgi:hypothetical protein
MSWRSDTWPHNAGPGGTGWYGGCSSHSGLSALEVRIVGIGIPPSPKESSTDPASTNEPSRAGNGKCDAATLSLSPLSAHDALDQ